MGGAAARGGGGGTSWGGRRESRRRPRSTSSWSWSLTGVDPFVGRDFVNESGPRGLEAHKIIDRSLGPDLMSQG